MSTSHASSSSRRLPAWATSFGNQIIASLILGVLLGALALALGGDAKSNPNWLMTTLDTIGSSYVTLLKAAVIPLVFTAVVASISNLAQVTNAARLAVNTLIWFAITAFFAVSIGIILGLVVQPGVGAQVQGKPYTGSTGSWTAFLTGLIPVNFLGLGVSAKAGDSGITASASFNVLQILVISGAVGIAALKVGEAAKPFIDVAKSALAIIQKILWWIIRLAPLGSLRLRLGIDGLAGQVHHRAVRGSASGVPRGLPADCSRKRPVGATVLLRRVARGSDGLRLALLDGYHARHPDRGGA